MAFRNAFKVITKVSLSLTTTTTKKHPNFFFYTTVRSPTMSSSECEYDGILFGMGNPLLDISADVPMEFVEKYGVAEQFGNAVMADENQLPVYDDMLKNFSVELTAGGATQNVMRVCQWMLKKGPNKVTFMGSIGDDEYGKMLIESAKSAGVNVRFHIDKEHPTGTCACLIVGKERTLIANLAAANHYKVGHLLQPENQELMKKAKFYYISGFFLTVSPESIMHVAQHAAAENKVFCMNISANFIPQFFKDQLMAAFPYMDFVFGNEDEARAFAKAMGWDTEDVTEIAKLAAKLDKVNKQRPRTVVFTQGADPVVVVVGDEEPRHFKVKVLPSEKIVDSNGAGDFFCGGFLSQLVQGKDMDTCVKAGIHASSIVLQHSGAVWGDESPDFE